MLGSPVRSNITSNPTTQMSAKVENAPKITNFDNFAEKSIS